MTSKEGAWFSRAIFMKDVARLRTRYAEAGYAAADLDPQTDLDTARATVDLTVVIQRNAGTARR